MVAFQTLEHFLEANNIRRVDYMKMNVEGAEYDILLKAPNATVEAIAFMLIECHLSDEHRGEDLVDWLERCGFATDVVWGENESGKGWIAVQPRN